MQLSRIGIIFLSVICTSPLFAQTYTRKTPAEKAKKYTEEMVQEQKLDSVQAAEVYVINLAVSTKIDSMYATHPEQGDLRKGFMGIFKMRDEAFRKILTATQYLQFDDSQREKRERKAKEKKAAAEKLQSTLSSEKKE